MNHSLEEPLSETPLGGRTSKAPDRSLNVLQVHSIGGPLARKPTDRYLRALINDPPGSLVRRASSLNAETLCKKAVSML